ncbi:MAG: threonine/serine dehydratase [Actinomycetota bacterium]|nr:threonine/serine dehydratase [Actinomycetota bacterium]
MADPAAGAGPATTAPEPEAPPEPTLVDVLAARPLIQRHLPRTPFYESISLGRMLGLTLFVKYENHQPVGAFKVRGNINKVLSLTAEERARGVVTASMGNHGQGVCYAARIAGVGATVVMPEEANPDKVEAMRNLGAEVVFSGRDFEEANEAALELERDKGFVYFHAANDPRIIAGHGTIGLEMLEDVPDLDALVLPVGAGGLISGVALAAKTLNPAIEIIGVQAKNCAPFYRSRVEGRPVNAESANTFAEGLASRTPTPLPSRMIARLVDDLIVATEEELRRAVVLLLEKTHNLAEGAGAAGTAGVVRLHERLAGKRVGTVLSGGNLNRHVLERALTDTAAW